MSAEITGQISNNPAGWIFFDAECRFCVAHRRRWGAVFERRGFIWLALQTPGTAERLGITESQLQAEMWVQLTDGRKYSGVNAWGLLMRHVWWLWLLGLVIALPGFNGAAQAGYRWIARRRHCLGGVCRIPSHHKTTPHPREIRLVVGLLGFVAVSLAAPGLGMGLG